MATTTNVELFGRTKIESAVELIDETNVMEVVTKAARTHDQNVKQIDELLNYYKGDQAIQERVKEYRDDILNKITENRAKEIVDFKVGYLCRGPIQYISRGTETTEEVQMLNDYMLSEDKASQDKRLITWMNIAGVGVRMVLDDKAFDTDEVKAVEDQAPFELYTVDPRKSFVIYSSGIAEQPLAGVFRVTDNDRVTHYTVYTNDKVYRYTSESLTVDNVDDNGYGMIPIVEYPLNEARLGAFEPVIPLLDALNDLDSNRLDGVEQFIQNLIIATNCDFSDEDSQTKIMQAGIVNLKSIDGMEQKLQMLNQELNQSQTQTLKDDIEQSIKEICHMPNRNGRYSTSDTGVAVVYRDGWSAAETDAVGVETLFIESERKIIKLALKICGNLGVLELEPSKMDVHFTRRNYENTETKSQVLISMLNCEKIDPKYAFIYCNMFSDPEQAYQDSMNYYNSSAVKTEEPNSEIIEPK